MLLEVKNRCPESWGPLAKCSFEEVTDMLTKAGIFAEIDRITGISANIMLGQIPQCGTGDSQILLDEEKLMDLLRATDDDHPADTTITHNVPDAEDAEDICTIENLTFDFTIPEVTHASMDKVNIPTIKVV